MKIKAREVSASAELTQNLHPVLEKIMLGRGATDQKGYSLDISDLLKPDLLLNIDKAVALLFNCLKQQSKILIIGDFDADGATSTVLLKLCLQKFGYAHVDYLVPAALNL